ncbi:hypothetical protein FOPG_15113 [Fusarium oxysporum f. sp. conglutinans race 2 54008]|uniref:Uncharacterized protein n=1 Tax=Fusarium oxysporum f. sp. conglutinans race 2 54008 TaxID=1089457 RepID=X0HAK3_FUSOX|nr:hypothetical protein FOPG_15113 [Fusarium oxysporum f. sp. conglutinans race 2 54008]KAG7002861.1 hypothetical protein FocnCong_v000966 [Fusarium oxysporum f. sp. conglutinans]KAI8395793.1 hypothetical protein FOFC_21323 [Fusarium oxysporum]
MRLLSKVSEPSSSESSYGMKRPCDSSTQDSNDEKSIPQVTRSETAISEVTDMKSANRIRYHAREAKAEAEKANRALEYAKNMHRMAERSIKTAIALLEGDILPGRELQRRAMMRQKQKQKA